MRVAHFAFDFSLGNKCRDGVDDNDVNATRTNQHVGNFQRLLTGIRLGDQEVIRVDAEGARIDGIKCVFGVDKCRVSTCFLRAGNCMKCNGRLTGGFRAVDFNDAPSRQTANSKSDIKSQRTSGDHLHRGTRIISQSHDRSLTKLLIDLREREL